MFQGFLNLQWSRWKRVGFTRLVAIAPTFYVAFFSDINDLSGMNDLLNAVMSLQLPFATLPVIAFTSNPRIMGEFTNGLYVQQKLMHLFINRHLTIFFNVYISSGNIVITIILSVVIISINIYFVIYLTIRNLTYNLPLIIGVIVYGTIYLLMCAYLTLHLAISMLNDCSVLCRNPVSIHSLTFYISLFYFTAVICF